MLVYTAHTPLPNPDPTMTKPWLHRDYTLTKLPLIESYPHPDHTLTIAWLDIIHFQARFIRTAVGKPEPTVFSLASQSHAHCEWQARNIHTFISEPEPAAVSSPGQ